VTFNTLYTIDEN